nr:DUF2382 domain-containing protein [Solirubrobacter soli]
MRSTWIAAASSRNGSRSAPACSAPRTSFVPIADAQLVEHEVRLGYTKDQIKDAPNVDADGSLSRDDERALYEYYGRSDYGDYDGSDRETTGRDTTTDDAMTRSEEELRVATTERESGRVRLQKYVVEEELTKTVPVRREEVRVEREPISDANRGPRSASGSRRSSPPKTRLSPRPSARSRSTSTATTVSA